MATNENQTKHKAPTKYDQVAAKIANKGEHHEGVIDEPSMQTLAMIPQSEGGSAIAAYDPAVLQALLDSGAIELAPVLYTLQDGEMICVFVDSKGSTELLDQNTKQPKTVRTWLLTLVDPVTGKHGRKISILGAAQLDRQLEAGDKDNPKMVGRYVIIGRGSTSKTAKGNQLTEYQVGVYKKPIGAGV
jgi:hypothetical protein